MRDEGCFTDLTTKTHNGARAIQARNHAPTGAVVSPIKIPLAKARKRLGARNWGPGKFLRLRLWVLLLESEPFDLLVNILLPPSP
jgi:hypothetical protein